MGRAIQRKDQNQHLRKARKNLSGRSEAIHHGHVEIEYDELWFEEDTLLDGFQTVGGFSANLPLRLSLEQGANHVPNVVTVIDNQDADQGRTSKDKTRKNQPEYVTSSLSTKQYPYPCSGAPKLTKRWPTERLPEAAS